VLAAQGQTPAFTSAGVLNAASLAAGTIAPGMVANITGSNLGTVNLFTCSSVLPLTTNCNGVQVLVNGQAAPVASESASEITFQVPFNVSGSATIQVTSKASGSTLSSAIVSVPVSATVPGLYSISGAGTGTSYYFDDQQAGYSSQFSTAVQPGDTVELYGTGFGATNPVVAAGIRGPDPLAICVASVTMTINGASVPVQTAALLPADSFAKLTPGADEVVFTVPAGLAKGTYPVVVTVGGVQSQAVQLVVGPQPVNITSISPATPSQGTNQMITVNGSGFESGLTVDMGLPVSGSTTISGSSIQSVTATSFQMTVTFSTQGIYTIRIGNPDGGASSVFSFTVGGAAAGPVISTGGVVSNPTGLPGIGPNLYVNINGTNLSSTTDLWDMHIVNNTLPTELDGVTVTIGGQLAYVQYVSSTRIQVLTPTNLGTGTVTVQVTNANGTSAPVSVTSQQFAPGFFEWLNNQPVATHVDFTDAMKNGTYSGFTTVPAAPGEYIILWGSGFGPTNPATPNGTVVPSTATYFVTTTPTLTLNGQTMPYYATALAPGFVGLYQVVAQVPVGMPNGDWPVIATVNGVSSATGILLTVHN
jgi:uncharacterized protein (TIGR03437 family)